MAKIEDIGRQHQHEWWTLKRAFSAGAASNPDTVRVHAYVLNFKITRKYVGRHAADCFAAHDVK